MLTLSGTYTSHLAGETTDLCSLWRITRRDSQVFRFTDHDRDIVIAGDGTYSSAAYAVTAHSAAIGLSVTNGDASAIFKSGAITEADLRAGLWDGATAEIFECIWSNPSAGTRAIRRGVIGRVTDDGTIFRAEVRGVAHKLESSVGRLITPMCDAILGDARCGVSLTAYTFDVTVGSAGSRTQFTDTALAEVDDYFAFGLLTWLTGDNAGAAHEVKKSTSAGVITLFLPTVADIAAGDTATLIAGCDKSAASCVAKFDNAINFRGFPHLPGTDAVFAPKT